LLEIIFDRLVDTFPLDPTVQKIGSRVPMWLLKAAKDKQAEQKSN